MGLVRVLDIVNVVARPNDEKSSDEILSYILRNCFVEDEHGEVSSFSARSIVQYFLNREEDQQAAMDLLDKDYCYVGR